MVISSLRLVEGDLLKVEERLVDLLELRGGALKASAQMLFRAGGKRLRPALVLLSSRLFGPQPEAAVSIAAAVEMVHGASLIHDDVIDSTHLRRGQPTLNAVAGNRFSVLLGDFLLCQALLAVAELNQVNLVQVVSEAVAEMTTGQILELRCQGNLQTSSEDYLRMIDGKTSALMSAGCRLGALLTAATREQVEAVGRFGRYLGMAFQITDDVLDFWGDPEILGKPTGADLHERKYTLPFLDTYGRSKTEEQTRVQKLLSNGALSQSNLQEIVTWMEGYGAQARALESAAEYVRQAERELEYLPPGEAREAMRGLLGHITARER